ncbi:LysR family transcriptional regulator [Sphingobium sp.]|uniref:LysR family transcriptional regulator n=1 Tax=Sphingobium sp. TaxID=1912891 RepID=UPI0028BD5B2D|nr:LysR family transcriptional regulator [Sphingobium sp.]
MNRIAFYHLETLLWIARLGTFAAAAERLNASQPTISGRMRELERQIGFRLFHRQGRNMTFTVKGREFVRQCEDLWVNIEEMLLAGNDYHGATGIVRIGSGEIAAASCLPAFTNRMNAAMPGVSLEVEIGLTARLIDDLLGGPIDMVFAIGALNVSGINSRPLGQVELVWLASPSIARSMMEEGWIKNTTLPLWSVARHSPMHELMAAAVRRTSLRHLRVNSCNNVRSMIEIVEAGGGIGLFPRNMVASGLEMETLAIIDQPTPAPIAIQIAIRSNERDPVILEMFKRIGGIESQLMSIK